MRILVFNYGSSSVRCSLVETDGARDVPASDGRLVASASVERVGQPGAQLRDDFAGEARVREVVAATHAEAIAHLHRLLRDTDLGEVAGIGHRVVHGGEQFREAVRIDDPVERSIETLAALAPQHNPLSLAGIRAARASFPDTAHVAVFDTAFHHTLPPRAHVYPIPYELYETERIRRYGFHGTSHRYAAERAAELLGVPRDRFTGITCHLGNGASVTAVEAGCSVDTSMGLTPLEGLMMGTRSGDVDPGLLGHLAASRGATPQEVVALLSEESGLLGVSGVSSDLRDVERAAETGNPRARLALDIFAYRVRKYLGAYCAVLSRLDAIVFTGGMGENSAALREDIVRGLQHLGIDLDPGLNAQCAGTEAVISSPDAPVRIFVVPSREDRVIAREVTRLLGEA